MTSIDNHQIIICHFSDIPQPGKSRFSMFKRRKQDCCRLSVECELALSVNNDLNFISVKKRNIEHKSYRPHLYYFFVVFWSFLELDRCGYYELTKSCIKTPHKTLFELSLNLSHTITWDTCFFFSLSLSLTSYGVSKIACLNWADLICFYLKRINYWDLVVQK